MIDLAEAAMKIYGKAKNDESSDVPEDQRVIFPQEGAEEIVAKYGAEEEEERELTPDEIRYAIPLTREGERFAQEMADKYVETGDYRYVAAGVLASLWTPETAPITLEAGVQALAVAVPAFRPFARYVGPLSDPKSKWLTRGLGGEPPYGNNFALAKDKLQIPNEVTGVVEVRPKWYEPIRGPRTVKPTDNPEYGIGGGQEYYRDWKWPSEPPKGNKK